MILLSVLSLLVGLYCYFYPKFGYFRNGSQGHLVLWYGRKNRRYIYLGRYQ